MCLCSAKANLHWLNVQLHSNRVRNCTETFEQLPTKMISQKNRPREKEKHCGKRASGLFHSVKLKMTTKTHPLHLFIEERERFNVTPLPERSVGTRIRISNE